MLSFSKSSQAWKERLKHITCTFVAFLNYIILFTIFFFLSTWVLSVGEFIEVPPSHMKILLDHYKGPTPHQEDMPPLLIPVATMEKFKQANDFQ